MLPLHLLLLLLLPLVFGKQCAHYSQEVLTSRLESHVLKCLGPVTSPSVISTLTERFIANDFDRHQPLALMLFSNSSDLLHSLVGAVASSLFGASRSLHTVQSVDFQELLKPSRTSNYDIKQRLRIALVTPLHACPDRNLFVFDNVQVLDDTALPVLDVFLDPLNGKRAQFQHFVEGKASRVFDCTNSVFLFLYKVTASHFQFSDEKNSMMSSKYWREYLMQQWTRSEGIIEEFTPQAFVGRLTDAVAVFLPEGDNSIDATYDQFRQSHEWRQMCKLLLHEVEDRAIGPTKASTTAALAAIADTIAAAAPMIPGAIAMIAIPAFLLVLTRAKRWNGEIRKLKKRGAIHRRSSDSNNARRKKKKMRKRWEKNSL
ncbi:unnamed protein product [Peronospora farinosa]|uniref:Uncharacterized protein n=1 Tax=Peronospora farinosa TaxID=134698 RepID=A0AAV0STW1_9STRA|nr:unnamed protein product [Peronospora farinosa]CAI5705782.1 unnamed protein product [Peronospora farinosa]